MTAPARSSKAEMSRSQMSGVRLTYGTMHALYRGIEEVAAIGKGK